jgi:hypothetical protein
MGGYGVDGRSIAIYWNGFGNKLAKRGSPGQLKGEIGMNS